MVANDADQLISTLKGLFPIMTLEQGIWWRDRFENMDAKHVRIAIKRYSEMRSDAVDRPQLLALIQSEVRRESTTQIGRILTEKEQNERHWSKVDDFIAGLDDAELAELKAKVLAAKPTLTDVLAGRDPRTSRTLKALIYQGQRA